MTADPLRVLSHRFADAAERIPTALYKIPYAIEDVLSRLESGEVDEDIAKAELAALAGEFKSKALATGTAILNYESQAGACQVEIDRLTARVASLNGRGQWLREYVRAQMQAVDVQDIQGGTFSLTRKLNPPKVLVIEEHLIPAEYMRQPPIPPVPPLAPDKIAITKYWKTTGEDVPGTRVVQDERLDLG